MTTERPRIWMIDGSVAMTGAFVSARDMARALHNKATVVLVLPDTSQIAKADMVDFAAVHYLPIRPLRRGWKHVAQYLPFLLLATLRLRRLMLRDGADALLVNDFYLMQGALLRLLGYRGRILTWVRIDPNVFGRIGRVWLATAAWTSDNVISVSMHIKSLLPASLPSDLLYDPVSAEFCSPTSICRSFTKFDFVFLGNYIPGKGQNIAITALADVLKSFPRVRLHFYGGDMGLTKNREYRRSLESQAERLRIREAIYFGGYTPSPRRVLEGAFAALNLSQSESFSRTVLEASACGLPVIATRCGGPEEIIDDKQTGLLIPIDDARACADAMRFLCQDPESAVRMGTAGRQRVLQTFGHETFAKQLHRLLF